MITVSFFSARPEMKYQQLAIAYLILSDLVFIKLFTLINQNRSQILIIDYIDKQLCIIY